ncbi:MAG: MoxR family ATPase [Nitrososphaerota archaeon]|jgi:MoxR-like ATPase|nr:MoxR family ATPase [Nitrososphaerota archaeon]MDG6956070.1 MoxR family ATPase [Nitrososphaerota archaeon]MDG6957536.1 MoxR family ATPase [Nitrososphaerota archaeon]MDG6959237.1 MoxR family ATPase [Nitrososphaerota archaeon]MDG6969086.1 MoxR family ATPase [Nitrososphaerota archaeon]
MDLRERVSEQISNVVIGREKEVKLLLVSFLAGGHVLLEGVPGVSKTVLAKSFARCMGIDFKRIQFTPDMLPMDMVGGFVFNMKDRVFDFRKGPVFTNILLADEINRAPPKVQSALLEAMQEFQVTVEGQTETLPRPFMVIATQNPQEFHGVYPLPENQLDRFLMRIEMSYPDLATESALIKRNLGDMDTGQIKAVVSAAELVKVLEDVQKVKVSDEIIGYLATIAKESRAEARLSLGASPRAMVHMTHCARALAFLEGRDYVTPEDVKQVAVEVLGHRLKLDQSAVLVGKASDPGQIVREILTRVKPPR